MLKVSVGSVQAASSLLDIDEGWLGKRPCSVRGCEHLLNRRCGRAMPCALILTGMLEKYNHAGYACSCCTDRLIERDYS